MTNRPARQITRWYQKIMELANGQDQQQIAQTIGVTKGTVTGWKNGAPPKPDSVIAAARAYDVDPLELLATAYMEPAPPKRKRRRRLEADPNAEPL